jgi:hypothetical protein
MIKLGDVHLQKNKDERGLMTRTLFNSPIRLNVGSTTEKNSSGPIIGGCKRKHGSTSTSGVNAHSIGDVVEWCLLVSCIVQKCCCPIGLQKQLP